MKAYELQKAEINRAEQRIVSEGKVAENSAVWEHHFPQFPVLPGVLMLDLLKASAEKWYGKPLQMKNVKRVRFSNYLKPGMTWQSRMKRESSDFEGDRWSGEIFSADMKMASAVLTLSVKG